MKETWQQVGAFKDEPAAAHLHLGFSFFGLFVFGQNKAKKPKPEKDLVPRCTHPLSI